MEYYRRQTQLKNTTKGCYRLFLKCYKSHFVAISKKSAHIFFLNPRVGAFLENGVG